MGGGTVGVSWGAKRRPQPLRLVAVAAAAITANGALAGNKDLTSEVSAVQD